MRGRRRPQHHLRRRNASTTSATKHLGSLLALHLVCGRGKLQALRSRAVRWAALRALAMLAAALAQDPKTNSPDTLHVCDTVVAADGSRTSMPNNWGRRRVTFAPLSFHVLRDTGSASSTCCAAALPPAPHCPRTGRSRQVPGELLLSGAIWQACSGNLSTQRATRWTASKCSKLRQRSRAARQRDGSYRRRLHGFRIRSRCRR